MNMPNVSKFIRKTEVAVIKHSPEILQGIGIAGMITSTILAVKATPKALTLIEQIKKEERKDELTVAETVKVAWKPYIPAAVTCVASVGCLIGASRVSLKRNAALATAYELSKTAFTDYKAKVIETIGEKKEQHIREEVAADKVKNSSVESKDVIITGTGTTICWDVTFNQIFESDIESIKRAINNLNYKLLSQEYVSLNDFYDELGLNRIAVGEELGWNMGKDGMIDISFGTAMTKVNGVERPCVTLEYYVAPRYNYYKLM